MNPITGLLTALGALTVFYVAAWARLASAARRLSGRELTPATDGRFPGPTHLSIGAVANFFDALGIGSFATTTAVYKFLKLVPDRVIPGTLNAGHALPTIAQAFIFVKLIPVDVTTLFSMITASVLGAWLGAGVVARWSKQKVQIGMGTALLAAAAFMLMKQLSLYPVSEIPVDLSAGPGSVQVAIPEELLSKAYIPVAVSIRNAGSPGPFTELTSAEWSWEDRRLRVASLSQPSDVRVQTARIGVQGALLATAIAGNFFLGALMTLGIGLYAPCMILVSLLGMSERTAFPIMMGSCAFLMPIGSLRFIRERSYSLRAALGLAIGGVPGVLVAGLIVKKLPLDTVRWLVIVVVVYTAAMMLGSALSRDRSPETAEAEA